MTVSTSMLLIAAGAILRYAVTVHPAAVNLRVAGLILMLAGAAGVAMWTLRLAVRS